MANQIPIYLHSDGPFVDFKIPEEHRTDNISISINIELLDDGWKFDSDHIVTIQGNPNDLYNADPAPDKVAIGTGEKIAEKKFRTFSRIRRISDGAEEGDKPSRVKFTIQFFAGDILLDQSERTCDNTNPENFITNINFQ